uniref:Uncharacterized protein n=1 Tax=viral metagenome TaxID=1070528 RepID=A0A6C0JRV2_9ZZZZ
MDDIYDLLKVIIILFLIFVLLHAFMEERKMLGCTNNSLKNIITEEVYCDNENSPLVNEIKATKNFSCSVILWRRSFIFSFFIRYSIFDSNWS